MSSQLWLRMAGYLNYISYRYVFMYYFVSLTKYAGRKLNNLMWPCMAEEFMSIHYYEYGCCANVLFLDYREQDSVSVKRGYIWRDKSCISSTVMYLDYILFH